MDHLRSESNLRSLDSLQRDDFAREALIDDARAGRHNPRTEAARRALAEAQEKQFRDRYNRLMRALTQFAESYNSRHAIDTKLLHAVKQALRDLQKQDAWFRETSRNPGKD